MPLCEFCPVFDDDHHVSQKFGILAKYGKGVKGFGSGVL